MAAGWSVMDALNKNSKAAADDTPKARFRTRDISIKKIYPKWQRMKLEMPNNERRRKKLPMVRRQSLKQ